MIYIYIYLLQTVIWHSYTLNYQRAKPFGIARVVLNCKAISIPKPEIDPLMEIYPMDPGNFLQTGSHGPLGRAILEISTYGHFHGDKSPEGSLGSPFLDR